MPNINYGVDGLEPEFSLDTSFDLESLDYIAEEAAEDYQENHDGWEAVWPVEISIFNGDELLGKYEVHREYEPRFSANEI